MDKKPMSISQLLRFYQNEKKPQVAEYNPNFPEQFTKDLHKLEAWQKGQALKFFQNLLGIGDRTYIAARIQEKLQDFGGEAMYEYIPTKKNNAENRASNILKYLTAPEENGQLKKRVWNRETLFFVCMALEICKSDSGNARRLFNLSGVCYARFSNPRDIVFAWATEKNYNYLQFDSLFKKTKPYSAGFDAENDKIKKKGCGSVRALENQNHTDTIEDKFRSVWLYNNEDLLIARFKEYSEHFHNVSYVRSEIIAEILDDEGFDDDKELKKYRKMVERKRPVERDDIIGLACKSGKTILEIDQLLEEAGFPLINSDFEICGKILREKELPNKEKTRLLDRL